MSNRNKFLILLIVIIILFLIGLTLYKNKEERKEKDKNQENYEFLFETPTKTKDDLIYNTTLDKDVYSDKIITEYKTSINYEFYNTKKSIVGKIYINDQDKYLYMTNEMDNELIKLSNIKFKTMYYKEYSNYNEIIVFLISEQGDLYYLELASNNIKTAKINKLDTKYKVSYFVDINFDNDVSPSVNTLFVLEEDGNIYEVLSGIRYKEGIKTLFDSIIVFEDNSIANIYGKMLTDNNGNNYKIKYAFYANSDEEYVDSNGIIIITEDNMLLLLLTDEYYTNKYEVPLKVKNIKFDQHYPFVDGKLYIELENGDSDTFEARCSSYYCINDFNM